MKHYEKYGTPFGDFYIGYNEQAIVEFSPNPETYEDVPSDLSRLAAMQLDQYFRGDRREFDLPIEVAGTGFQMKVWHALVNIPYGEVRTYGEIAAAVGNPKACRAVGMANNRNPIGIIIPCHRVVAADGIGGYGWGVDMKKALLELESKIR